MVCALGGVGKGGYSETDTMKVVSTDSMNVRDWREMAKNEIHGYGTLQSTARNPLSTKNI